MTMKISTLLFVVAAIFMVNCAPFSKDRHQHPKHHAPPFSSFPRFFGPPLPEFFGPPTPGIFGPLPHGYLGPPAHGYLGPPAHGHLGPPPHGHFDPSSHPGHDFAHPSSDSTIHPGHSVAHPSSDPSIHPGHNFAHPSSDPSIHPGHSFAHAHPSSDPSIHPGHSFAHPLSDPSFHPGDFAHAHLSSDPSFHPGHDFVHAHPSSEAFSDDYEYPLEYEDEGPHGFPEGPFQSAFEKKPAVVYANHHVPQVGYDKIVPQVEINQVPQIAKVNEPVPQVEKAMEQIPQVEKAMEQIPQVEKAMEQIPQVEKTMEPVPHADYNKQHIPHADSHSVSPIYPSAQASNEGKSKVASVQTGISTGIGLSVANSQVSAGTAPNLIQKPDIKIDDTENEVISDLERIIDELVPEMSSKQQQNTQTGVQRSEKPILPNNSRRIIASGTTTIRPKVGNVVTQAQIETQSNAPNGRSIVLSEVTAKTQTIGPKISTDTNVTNFDVRKES